MDFINNKEFLKNIAQHLNLFNTISGGISETQVTVDKYKKGAVIKVWAAGVTPESFKVLVHNNELTVYSLLHSTDNPDLHVPMFNQVFMLPPQVNINEIEAVYHNGKLQIRLPYHSAAIRPKEIEIKQL
ncbi:Hsp20/alpha crystallin family protein [Pontibacter sp. KCTC 32443]|uniref:Hsp20/alpha crystallin family protein n=1 Tax=Pontibacter TaxID=323449 RepID=UPI00164D9939|nr:MULTISPECIES: Hsp20/alpha crystallin family protein [Pontibacter]MBC5775711.1 Hsp20/alpha crystallin family protein [Pontibacter sp. KCTC 32443]